MRADAQRNRDRIVEVARVVFRERGYDASLDDIAKQAGVGPGTLYRHFPTRDALLDAVMQAWVDRVTETTDKALTYEGPAAGLPDRLVRGVRRADQPAQGRTGQDHPAMGDEDSPIATKTPRADLATQRIVDHLNAQGALRDGVDALQMCRLVGGVAVVADQGGLDADAVRPMLAVVADGMLR